MSLKKIVKISVKNLEVGEKMKKEKKEKHIP